MVSMDKKVAEEYPNRDRHFMTKKLTDIYFVTMTRYYKEYDGNLFIKPMDIKNTLGEVLAENELRQLHIAETEKYAHVTKFFNGDQQIVYDREKDILVPSHKVPTFDLDPEMSAQEIHDAFVVNSKDFDFSVINFANGDIIGHT
jgi:2,3-bisphosphoglycerate-independent phosphoglycerate mutase